MPSPAFSPRLSDVFRVQILASEAVIKDEKMPIGSAIEQFIALYEKEKDQMTPEQMKDFKAKFQTTFSPYFTAEQQDKIFHTIQRPSPLQVDTPKAAMLKLDELPRTAETVLKNRSGFINISIHDLSLLRDQIGDARFFICLDPKDKSQFFIVTPKDIFEGECRKKSVVVHGMTFSTVDTFILHFVSNLKPLEVYKGDHPTWETMPSFYNEVEGDEWEDEPTVPFSMPLWNYCICKSAIPGCLSMPISLEESAEASVAFIVPLSDGKFIYNKTVYDSIEQIVEAVSKEIGHPLKPFDVTPFSKQKLG